MIDRSLLVLLLSLVLFFLPSSIDAQQVTATIPTAVTLPLPAPIGAQVTYSVNEASAIVVVLIRNPGQQIVGETFVNVNQGNNQQVTINNLKINAGIPSTGTPAGQGTVSYRWRVYSVNQNAYAFSPSVAFLSPSASQEITVTVNAVAPPPTTTTTTSTRPPSTTTTTTTRAATTTTRPATGTTTTRPPITTPAGGGGGGQTTLEPTTQTPDGLPTNPPEGVIYKIISSTAVAGRWGVCVYSYQSGDSLASMAVKLETTVPRIVQLNIEKFSQVDYAPAAGDQLNYDCFLAEGASVDPNGNPQAGLVAPSNKSWIDNNVVIFIVVIVVGFCVTAFLSIVVYRHLKAKLSADTNKQKMVAEAKPAPPMSTPANKQWNNQAWNQA